MISADIKKTWRSMSSGNSNKVSKKTETKKNSVIIPYIGLPLHPETGFNPFFTSGCLTIRLRSDPLNLDRVMPVRKGKRSFSLPLYGDS